VITSEDLHRAADKVTGMTAYPEGAEIDKFIEESQFHNHDIDPISLSYGIAIGILVMKDDKEEA